MHVSQCDFGPPPGQPFIPREHALPCLLSCLWGNFSSLFFLSDFGDRSTLFLMGTFAVLLIRTESEERATFDFCASKILLSLSLRPRRRSFFVLSDAPILNSEPTRASASFTFPSLHGAIVFFRADGVCRSRSQTALLWGWQSPVFLEFRYESRRGGQIFPWLPCACWIPLPANFKLN